MNKWIMPMAFIVFGLFVGVFALVSADLGDDSTETTYQGCDGTGCPYADKGGCSPEKNCGNLGCAAAYGMGGCGCGAK